MKGSDILALAKAGFSLEQIVQINDVLTLPGDDEKQPEPAAQPAAQPDTGAAAAAVAEAIGSANAKLEETLAKIQKANIAKTEQPASEVETTDSILGNLIKGTPLPGKDR